MNIWQGCRLETGQLDFQGTQAEVDLTTGRGAQTHVLGLHPDTLVDAVRTLACADGFAVTKTWATYSPSPAAFDRLDARLNRLLAQCAAHPQDLASPESREYEQECVRALAEALCSSTSARPDLPLPARSAALRRAEDLMRSRLRDPVSAIELCRELAVSDRTLRLAFRERYGVGPMTYLRFLRLNAVRTRLQAEREVPIAEAARAFGFHHLGNFAADYRRLFGMRPSETPRP